MDQPQETVNVLRDIINRSQAPGRIEQGGVPFLILNQGERAEAIEKLLPRPVRKAGKPVFQNVDSFTAYVNTHKGEPTRIYVPNATQFQAVINGHSATEPGWGDHIAFLALKTTQEWNTWTGQNGKRASQRDFAQFIEDNLDDVTEPAGADMLDLVRFFQSTQSAEFKSVASEKPGNQKLEYTQVAVSRAGSKGDMELPDRFLINLSVYEGGTLNQIVARLRYSVTEGKLALWYDLFRVQKFVDLAVRQISEDITKATGIAVWHGQPG